MHRSANEKRRAIRNLVIFTIVTLGCGFVGAALDRLTHRCPILETQGESDRLQDAKRHTVVRGNNCLHRHAMFIQQGAQGGASQL